MSAFPTFGVPAYQTMATRQRNPLEELTQRSADVSQRLQLSRDTMQRQLAQSEQQAHQAAMDRLSASSRQAGIAPGRAGADPQRAQLAQYPDMSDADIQATIDAHLGGGLWQLLKPACAIWSRRQPTKPRFSCSCQTTRRHRRRSGQSMRRGRPAALSSCCDLMTLTCR